MKRYYTGRKSTALNRARQALIEGDRPMTTEEILESLEAKGYIYLPSAISLGQLLSRYHGFVQVGERYKFTSASTSTQSGFKVAVWGLEEWDGEE